MGLVRVNMTQSFVLNEKFMLKISDLTSPEYRRKIEKKVKNPIFLHPCGNQISVQVRHGYEPF